MYEKVFLAVMMILHSMITLKLIPLWSLSRLMTAVFGATNAKDEDDDGWNDDDSDDEPMVHDQPQPSVDLISDEVGDRETLVDHIVLRVHDFEFERLMNNGMLSELLETTRGPVGFKIHRSFIS
eukprot:TRINITY_DN31092_c0_g1_i1.p1 TRINITY_DN31092_c0_g1~~TRINITY_DN31092_c0_g1_i1.p1  ORF type:complete len:124 (+),score=35.03 TRINITY_DN31092_c0_g1_i1:131-502(+)